MTPFARKIDALGGVPASDDYDAVVHTSGYNEAIGHATPIAEDADALIEELVETLSQLLYGHVHSLSEWTRDAETLLRRVRGGA